MPCEPIHNDSNDEKKNLGITLVDSCPVMRAAHCFLTWKSI